MVTSTTSVAPVTDLALAISVWDVTDKLLSDYLADKTGSRRHEARQDRE